MTVAPVASRTRRRLRESSVPSPKKAIETATFKRSEPLRPYRRASLLKGIWRQFADPEHLGIYSITDDEKPQAGRRYLESANVKQLANLNLHRNRFLEPLLIVVIFSMTALMGYYSVETPVLLHLFYVPVVLTGSLQGRYRARVMALLCILSSLIIFVPHLNQESLDGELFMTLLVFGLWAATLVLIAVLVGSLSDGWRSAMAKLTEAHKKRRPYRFPHGRGESSCVRVRASAADCGLESQRDDGVADSDRHRLLQEIQ